MLKTFWAKTPGPAYKKSNFGDVLTPIILEHYGIDCCYADIEDAEALCIGSIARHARSGTMVLGSGAMRNDDKLCADAHWVWVRGPRTRAMVLRDGGDCPEIYGDPALLLPEIIARKDPAQYSVGIVPHVRHYREAKEKYPEYHVINLATTDPVSVLKEILLCEKVISSSLHGIVVAHAYGIPAAWVKFSTSLAGDDTKFHDYYEAGDSSAVLSSVESPIFSTVKTDIDAMSDLLTTKKFLK
jgi:hypothetical protein